MIIGGPRNELLVHMIAHRYDIVEISKVLICELDGRER